MRVRWTDGILQSLIKSLVVVGLCSGCGNDVDPRFAAETHDEYTEPLTNAVIGTPDGVIVIPGSNEQAGTASASGSKAAPSAASGTGSSSSTSSSSVTTGGVTGSGGSVGAGGS